MKRLRFGLSGLSLCALAFMLGAGGSALGFATPVRAQSNDDPSAIVMPGQASRQEAIRLANPQTARQDPPARQTVRATGGLRALPDETQPGSRFFTASQAQPVDEEALRRFAVPDATILTGSVPADSAGEPLDEQALPEQARPVSREETDPYAAIGIRRGPLTWFPAIDLAIGYDSNVDSTSNAREVRTVRLSPELRVESDWRRHAWNGSLRGTLDYVDDGRDLGHTLDIDNELRLDVGLDTAVTLRGGYALSGEAASDLNAAAGADGVTDTHTLTASAGVTQTIGLITATATGAGSRVLFSDTPLGGGGTQDNRDRNRLDGSLTVRLERAEGPIVRPFVEGTASLRRFDERLDRNGFARDSLGYGLRGGLIIADEGPVRGEASLGFLGEQFDDNRLESVLALSAAASLTWDVTSLTSVTLDLGTTLDPTTQAGAGVGTTRTASLGLTHDLRRNVDLRLGAGVSDTRFSGIAEETRTYSATAGMTWRASPTVAFRLDTGFEHEPDAAGDINRFTAEAGVTLRR